MKRLLTLGLFFLSCLVINIPFVSFGAASSGAGLPGGAAMDPFELLNNMDPKELDKILDELSRMSPEEIKYYEDLGKEMFKQSGYDLDALAKPAAAPQQQPAKVTPKVETATTKPAPAEIESSKKEKDSIMRMMKQLSESLASIRQKAAMDETLHPHIATLHYDLDLLTAYVNRLDFDKHLKYLSEKEFAPLKTKLRKISLTLEELDNNLSVPEVTFKKDINSKPSSTRSYMIEEAKQVLNQFKSYMQNAFSTDTIITDIENLFKKYDKDALEIKKKIEEQHKKAFEQVKKLPTTNTGVFAAPTKYSNQPSGQRSQNQGGAQGAGASQGGGAGAGAQANRTYPAVSGMPGAKPSMPQQQQKDGATKSPAKKGEDGAAEKGKEKEKDAVQMPLTFEERGENLKSNFKKLNAEVGRNKTDLLRISSAITTTATPAPVTAAAPAGGAVPAAPTAPVPAPKAPRKEDVDVLEKVVIDFKKLREEFTKFFKDLEAKEPQKIVPYKKVLKNSFDNKELPDLYLVKTEFDAACAVPLTGPASSVEEIKDSVDLMTKFNKHFDDMKRALSSRRSV